MTQKPPPNTKAPPPLKIRFLAGAISALCDLARRNDGTINRRLLSYLEPSIPPNPSPVRHVTTADVTVDPTRNLYFRLFLPTDIPHNKKIPTIVFFHGGGFAFLSAASLGYDFVCRRFAHCLSAAVVSVNYRLSPEHKWPAPYVDGIDVIRYLDDASRSSSIAAADLDLSNTFLMGDSAGANIVHHVAKRYCSAAWQWQKVRLAGLVLIQPFFGGEERTESELRLAGAPLVSVERTDWSWKAFLPEGASRDHEGANFKVGGEGELGEGWPAAMVVVGGWDPLQDWQRRYAEWLRVEKGKEVRVVEYEEAVHAFYVLPGAAESGMLIEEIKGFMDSNNTNKNNKRNERDSSAL